MSDHPEGGHAPLEPLPSKRRPLWVWAMIGLAPSALHALCVLLAKAMPGGPANILLLSYMMGMPVVALLWLVACTSPKRRFGTPQQDGFSRGGFVGTFIALNLLLWVGGCAFLFNGLW